MQEVLKAKDSAAVGALTPAKEKARLRSRWRIEKFLPDRKEPYEILEFEGNCLLNEGINEIWKLLMGESANHFDAANSQIGVGDGTAAEDPTQTDLQGLNTAYKGMDTGYPSISGNTITFKATFSETEANFAWEEITVKHASSAINLNRKVQNMGTKASGTIWTATLEITLS